MDKDTDNWRIQVNRKIGQELVNVRGEDWITVKELMRQMISDSDEILAFFAAFEPQKPAELPTLPLEPSKAPTPPAPAPAPVRAPEPHQNGEMEPENGPAVVLKVQVNEGVNATSGKSWTRFDGNIGGVNVSTFDTLQGQAMKNLLGKSCYFRAKKSAKYPSKYDLQTIRSA